MILSRADVERVDIQTFNTAQIPVVEARVSAPGIDLSRNYDLLEARVLNRLRRIPGVARVELNGDGEPRIKGSGPHEVCGPHNPVRHPEKKQGGLGVLKVLKPLHRCGETRKQLGVNKRRGEGR